MVKRREDLSTPRTGRRLDVTYDSDAFGHEASARTREIHATVEQAFRGTRLDDADVSMTGMAATNADLADFSQSDMRVVALTAFEVVIASTSIKRVAAVAAVELIVAVAT